MERLGLPSPSVRGPRARGIAAVELALLLLILFPLVFGLIEYSWMFLKSQEISGAARDAARIAATESGTNALVDARITQAMTAANLAGSGYSVVTLPSNVASAPPGTQVQVTISVTYKNISLTGLEKLFPVPTVLQGSTSMVKEGP